MKCNYKIFYFLAVFLIATLNLQAQTPKIKIQEKKINTVQNTTSIKEFTAGSASYDIVDIPKDGRTNVIKINGAACEWNVLSYSLASYKGKPIIIRFSADVMRTGEGHGFYWQVNNVKENYPVIAVVENPVQGVWYHMSSKRMIIPVDNNPSFYLTSWENNFPDTFFYIDNISITIETWDYTPASVLASAGEANSNGARNYYVSASKGADSGNGTKNNPFLKIAHAMYYVKPGDTVLVDSGTYNEKFRIPSGSKGKPVTLTAMSGADVIITPTVQITSEWKQYKGNIYAADISKYVKYIDTEFPQLFADRDSMVEARFPNMGASMSMIHDYKRDVAQKGTNKNTVVASKNIPADIAGARLVICPGEDGCSWETATSVIQSVKGRTIKLSTDITSTDSFTGGDPYTPHPGNPYYITGALSLLDAPGEYFFDVKTNLLYFYPPWNGSPETRSLTLRGNNDITIYAENTSYVNIKDIKVFGGGIYMQNTNNSTLENCRVNYAEHFYIIGLSSSGSEKNSMIMTGSNNRIEKCEFGPTAGNGIVLGGEDSIFTNNIVHDTCYLGFGFFGIKVKQSKRLEISHNSIINSAHTHLKFDESNYSQSDFLQFYEKCIIRNNYFDNHATLNSDGGAFYAWGSDGGGTEIYNNFVVCGNKNDQGAFHKLRMGLYTDNYTSNYIVHHNIVIGATEGGLKMNLWSKGVKFYNNTVIDSNVGIGMYAYPIDNADASTSSFTDNLFVNTNKDISYWGTENGKQASYEGNFINGTIPAPIRQEGRVQSSGNERGTVDTQYRPTGKTPNIGAIPRNGQMFPYGADWKLDNTK